MWVFIDPFIEILLLYFITNKIKNINAIIITVFWKKGNIYFKRISNIYKKLLIL